eukprot:gene14675-2650_t
MYEKPQVGEVARIYSTLDRPQWVDIVIYPRGGRPVRVNHLNPKCDPLTYPILFPDGMDGFRLHLLYHKDHRPPKASYISAAEFYSHRLMLR